MKIYPGLKANWTRLSVGDRPVQLDHLNKMSEMGEIESLRMQMAMDRMSKLMSTLSNILKKSSDSAGQITQNLK